MHAHVQIESRVESRGGCAGAFGGRIRHADGLFDSRTCPRITDALAFEPPPREMHAHLQIEPRVESCGGGAGAFVVRTATGYAWSTDNFLMHFMPSVVVAISTALMSK